MLYIIFCQGNGAAVWLGPESRGEKALTSVISNTVNNMIASYHLRHKWKTIMGNKTTNIF